VDLRRAEASQGLILLSSGELELEHRVRCRDWFLVEYVNLDISEHHLFLHKLPGEAPHGYKMIKEVEEKAGI
jgi:hypothetical protein